MMIDRLFKKSSRNKPDPKVGIALGGGGAKGLSHILMLEALDELGVRPHMVSGCSIGAIAGLLYTSGMSGARMREEISRLVFSEKESITETLMKKDILKWITMATPTSQGGGLLKVDKFMSYLLDMVKVTNFDELEIPLKVVAADFWEKKQVVFETGDLKTAVQASMALPVIFTPVILDGTVLVDGGTVNPVPFDLLQDDCDLVIAVNVLGKRSINDGLVPSFFDALFNTFQIYEHSLINEKIRNTPPDIYIEPDIIDIRMLEFIKAEQIFEQAEPAKELLKKKLRTALNLDISDGGV